jgi:hypothetical protein
MPLGAVAPPPQSQLLQAQVSPPPALGQISLNPRPGLQEHPNLARGLASVGGLTLIYLLILGFKPRWLLLLPSQLKIPNTPVDLPLGLLLWLKYQPRVLDRWVADHRAETQDRFLRQATVKDRAIHIPIQIWLDGQPVDRLTPADLRPRFSESNQCLLLVGEGGVGKTSLACQIARWGLGPEKPVHQRQSQSFSDHRMLPVLIEQELGETPLLTAIKTQLPCTADGNFIPEELLRALLRQRRVLVILDHVSELSDGGYQHLQAALDTSPINALIITSRLPNKALGRVAPHVLEPRKIEGERLSSFIQPYLEAQGKRDLFEDDGEFFSTCTRLSRMMTATLQKATALLVRLYVDQIIDVGGLKTAQLPDNIPELMLRYLCWLN